MGTPASCVSSVSTLDCICCSATVIFAEMAWAETTLAQMLATTDHIDNCLDSISGAKVEVDDKAQRQSLLTHVCVCVCVCMQKDSTLSKLAAMEGAVPAQLQPAFKKVMQRLQQVGLSSLPPRVHVHRLLHICMPVHLYAFLLVQFLFD